MAINYLSYRMRSTQEIRTYLRQKEVTPSTIAEIISRLEKEKLINDLSFAKTFVRDRMHRSTKGPRVIMNELREKGVKAEIENDDVKQNDEESKFAKAHKWAQKNEKNKSQHAAWKRDKQMRKTQMHNE